MDLKERIEFFKEANIGDSVEIEYPRMLSSKTKTIKGKISGIDKNYIKVLKAHRDLFIDGHNFGYQGWYLPFKKIIKADVTEKAKYEDS